MRPEAPLSLDLDNKWSYLKTHGDAGWEDYPTYLDTAVSRILPLLADRGLTITFFIVGQDAERPENRDAIAAIAAAGHEIGNHSHHHEPWMNTYTSERVADEFDLAEGAIEQATGRRPVGFRGPGYRLSETIVTELMARGYRYDATVFPNVLNPLNRAYYLARSNLSREERLERKELFGTFRDGLRPNVPFRWRIGNAWLSEIPVTTFPGLRIPFHFSYLIYLARVSPRLAERYLRSALWLCRRRGTPPSMLLHPLDFLGHEDEPSLGFFPGMDLGREKKLALVARFVDLLTEHYQPVSVLDYSGMVASTTYVSPRFKK